MNLIFKGDIDHEILRQELVKAIGNSDWYLNGSPGSVTFISQKDYPELLQAEVVADPNATPPVVGSPAVYGEDPAVVIQSHIDNALTRFKNQLVTKVDNIVADIYSKPDRFTNEYTEREAAAQAYKDAGYTGTVDDWINSFAINAGKTSQEATDIILSQADNLRTALKELGSQRMRKYAILAAADKQSAQAVYDDIISHIQVVASSLT